MIWSDVHLLVRSFIIERIRVLAVIYNSYWNVGSELFSMFWNFIFILDKLQQWEISLNEYMYFIQIKWDINFSSSYSALNAHRSFYVFYSFVFFYSFSSFSYWKVDFTIDNLEKKNSCQLKVDMILCNFSDPISIL